MATRNLTRKYVDIRNAQRANRVTGFHENNVRVNGEDQGSLLETVKKILSFISFHFISRCAFSLLSLSISFLLLRFSV